MERFHAMSLTCLLSICICLALRSVNAGRVGPTMDIAVVNLHEAVETTGAQPKDAEHARNHFAKDRMAASEAEFDALEKSDPAKLARIAEKYGETAAELRDEVRKHEDVVIDPESEAVLYVCAGMALNESLLPTPNLSSDPEVTSAAIAYSADSAEPSTADAFTLHSRPGSARTIYLDFNGHTTTGKPRARIQSAYPLKCCWPPLELLEHSSRPQALLHIAYMA